MHATGAHLFLRSITGGDFLCGENRLKYTNIIDDMTWSYSRIGAYHQCPYQFLLHYIYGEKEEPMFFSDYGSFMHELIADHLKDGTRSDDLIIKYLKNFRKQVEGKAPNQKIFEGYFDRGAEYLSTIEAEMLSWNPIAVEEKYHFTIDGRKFVGIVDLVCKDAEGNIAIIDHKSHQLKPWSGRAKPTKSDVELDEYLRQLYLYCIPVKKKFGKYPEKLVFNCFRNDEVNRFIVEEFDKAKFDEAKQWVLDSINEIRQEDEWGAEEEFWKCRYICGLHDKCKYWKNGGDE